MTAPLVRPSDDRKIGGVAAAVADRFGWKRRNVRIAMVASIVLPGPQILAYLVGWAVIPGEETLASPVAEPLAPPTALG